MAKTAVAYYRLYVNKHRTDDSYKKMKSDQIHSILEWLKGKSISLEFDYTDKVIRSEPDRPELVKALGCIKRRKIDMLLYINLSDRLKDDHINQTIEKFENKHFRKDEVIPIRYVDDIPLKEANAKLPPNAYVSSGKSRKQKGIQKAVEVMPYIEMARPTQNVLVQKICNEHGISTSQYINNLFEHFDLSESQAKAYKMLLTGDLNDGDAKKFVNTLKIEGLKDLTPSTYQTRTNNFREGEYIFSQKLSYLFQICRDRCELQNGRPPTREECVNFIKESKLPTFHSTMFPEWSVTYFVYCEDKNLLRFAHEKYLEFLNFLEGLIISWNSKLIIDKGVIAPPSHWVEVLNEIHFKDFDPACSEWSLKLLCHRLNHQCLFNQHINGKNKNLNTVKNAELSLEEYCQQFSETIEQYVTAASQS